MWSQHSFKCQHSEIWIFWISLTIFYNVVVHFKYRLRFIFGSEHDLMQTVSPKPSNLIIWYFWKLPIYCLVYLFCLDNFEKIIYCLDKKIWQIIRTPNQDVLQWSITVTNRTNRTPANTSPNNTNSTLLSTIQFSQTHASCVCVKPCQKQRYGSIWPPASN